MEQTTRKIILLLFIVNCSLQIAVAQPTQEWVARYERPSGSSGIANQMALDKVGNCYVLGNTGANGGVMVLIKYNSSGDTAWTRTYPQTGNVGVVADSIGNVYITGYFGPSFGPYNIVTIKYNPGGVQQWLKIYDSGGNDECRDIAMDKTGNVYIGGFSDNQSLIIKYNVNGDTVWIRKYGEPNYRFPVIDLELDYQNNIYITGKRIHTTNNSGAQFTIKYDSNAILKWINSPLVTQMEFSVKLGIDNFGNVYVTGGSFSGKILTIKYNSNGNEVWQRIYDGPASGTDTPKDLKIDQNNDVIITGYTIESGNFGNYVTVKYDSSGDSLWVRKFSGPNNENDESYSLALDDSNNAYVTGRSFGNFSDWDYVTIKYNTNGMQQWIKRYPDELGGGGIAYQVGIDHFNNIFVTGIGHSSGISGYITVKYSQTVGVITISNNLPDKYELKQNFPNPFNPSTKISYQIIKNNSNVRLTVFDITGKQVAELVNEKQNAGYYEIAFEAGDLSSGIYFYKLITENFTETKKMVLIK